MFEPQAIHADEFHAICKRTLASPSSELRTDAILLACHVNYLTQVLCEIFNEVSPDERARVKRPPEQETIRAKLDDIWPDLGPCESEFLNVGEMALIETDGKPAVCIRLTLKDGRTLVAEAPAIAFYEIAKVISEKYPNETP